MCNAYAELRGRLSQQRAVLRGVEETCALSLETLELKARHAEAGDTQSATGPGLGGGGRHSHVNESLLLRRRLADIQRGARAMGPPFVIDRTT